MEEALMATRPETSLWLKVHVDMLDHPKFNKIDNDSIVLWLAALSYSKKFLTDGVVEIDKIQRLPKVKRWRKCLESLVENNLFVLNSDEKTIEICGFIEWQQSREGVEEKREKAKIRKAEQRSFAAAQAAKKAAGPTGTGTGQEGGTNEPVPLHREQSTESQSTESQSTENLLKAEPKKSKPAKEKADSVSTRPRNVIWDAVVEICGVDMTSIPDGQRNLIGKVVAELAGLEATPEDIRSRGGIYKRKFPNAPLTPSALLKQWAGLTERSIPVGRPINAGTQRQTAQDAAFRMVKKAKASA
jgi:hypothetical protein